MDFQHGTTIGLNALIERNGPFVGLLATCGFRDVLDMKRGTRPDPYSLLPPPPDPLVRRSLRLPVRGRILASGEVYEPFVESDIADALDVFRAEGVKCVAIAFINSYVNPEHELAAERVLRRLGFTGDVSLSHGISRERGEYERTVTTVVDAFVRPTVARYVSELQSSLRSEGFDGAFLMARSGGGAITFDEACARPFETLASGPVAGCQGAVELAHTLELGDVITADVGGTSFDTSLIVGGRLPILFQGEVAGLTIQSSWWTSVPSGPGVDRSHVSMLAVCFGWAGERGRDSRSGLLWPWRYGADGDGRGVLARNARYRGACGRDPAGPRAERASPEPAGARAHVDSDEAARGVITLASSNMAEAMREITIERGQDPRDATLVAFGGAGPLFGTLLARELEIGQVVVPLHGGIFPRGG